MDTIEVDYIDWKPNGYFRSDYKELLFCPRCQKRNLPVGYPGALSRKDNETEICSECGTAEGLLDWYEHRV
jgi:hypothetical protein